MTIDVSNSIVNLWVTRRHLRIKLYQLSCRRFRSKLDDSICLCGGKFQSIRFLCSNLKISNLLNLVAPHRMVKWCRRHRSHPTFWTLVFVGFYGYSFMRYWCRRRLWKLWDSGRCEILLSLYSINYLSCSWISSDILSTPLWPR